MQTLLIAPLNNCIYSKILCPNLHSYGTEPPYNFLWRAHWWEPIHHTSLLTWNSSNGEGWCARGGSFPQGLPELSEAADDRLLHLTASRSNNCKSHLRESRPRDWSMSTGSFKAAAHIAQNREQHIFLKAQLYMPVTLYNTFYLCSTFQNAVTKCFTDNKAREVWGKNTDVCTCMDILMQIQFRNTATALLQL